jgi:hypothetical protein
MAYYSGTGRDIQKGQWFELETEDELKMLIKYGQLKKDSWGEARVQKCCDWNGPGKYYLLQYSQPCPRGCCSDAVNEVLTAEAATYEMSEALEGVAELIRAGRI